MPRRALILLAALAGTGAAAAGCGGGSPTTPTAAAPAPVQQVANGPARAAAPAVARRRPVHVAPSRAAVPILMYHVIGIPPAGAAYPGLWVAPDAFRAQVDALAGAGFTAVTLDTVLDAWQGRARLPAHPVVLSFDDGYLGQGTVAMPVLAARGWPGVINVVVKNIGIPGGISLTRLRQMVRAGWEVDAHSLTHPDLTTLAAAALAHELAGSRAQLRARLGVAVDAFCYPAGRYDAAVEAAARAAGYRAATTEVPGAARPGDDPWALPRIRVSGGDVPAAVLARVRAALGSGA
ncbi:polysaccharide deacetylase family protein [Baekduia soli]|uniref:Polysaccharide deacetylase family protein n=1 Tax=Baekduia soli TaxID=496014 RepID=A0A5B8U420_9ACTN|nr:polysaccharide deacetylase family protein [Baekduia soli]QEC47804.1 polysaccharide deacetylase family protein [Baekduia soli]